MDEGLFADLVWDFGDVEEVTGFLGVGCELVVPGYDRWSLRYAAHGEGVVKMSQIILLLRTSSKTISIKISRRLWCF